MWRVSGKVQPMVGQALYFELTPDGLGAREPELLAALGGGRIVSHTVRHEPVHSGPGSWLVTFVVDMDD
ncbi:hypothetical protein NWFMUON74_03870 [Nocardia wallacei]|uniref:Uncharacterized protein n=2 Tax=Nocardia wallacei TaxID=480035 RepID=A0A7G1KCA4_9NOCA|nr:hypothetical protein NWFMUON74_03870 [Nocardia wallacei]